MTFLKRLNAFCLATLLGATPFTGWADAGHDHGAPTPAALGSGLPRFLAVSETFELVGVLNGQLLTLYLDRATDNSPVKDAKLEIEIGGVKVDVKPIGDGEFAATLAQGLKPGVIAVTATVMAGQETDLLAGDLDTRATAPVVAATRDRPWRTYGVWLMAGLLTLALLAGGLRRLRTQHINRLGATK